MRRSSWAQRLVWTQFAVLLVMGLTVAGTAMVVGPSLFDQHMRQAGHDQPGVLDHAEQAYRHAVTLALGTGLVVALLIALATTWLLTRSLARGLDALTTGADRVAGGDYDHPVTMPPVGRELELVADEFNAMAQRIATTEATRRRMLTDLGHELRTPLAAVQVTLEGLQDGVVDWNADTLDVLQRQNRRLTALATDIAEVSRAQEGQLAVVTAPVDVDALVVGCAEAFRASSRAAGVRLHVVAHSGVTALADAERLAQVFDNLLRNALQHTKSGNQISVATEVTEASVQVTVADTGVGIDPAHLGHLFERFYRVPAARTPRRWPVCAPTRPATSTRSTSTCSRCRRPPTSLPPWRGWRVCWPSATSTSRRRRCR